MTEGPQTSRELLFGLMALQNGLISSDQLVAAFAKWTSDKSASLDKILIADGAVGPAVCDALHQMVRLHVDRHQGDVSKSLSSLPIGDLASTHEALSTIGDTDLSNTLGTIPNVHQEEPRPSERLGQTTSAGGRFRILRPLPNGKGGMGEISIAQDEELDRKVAVKQIRDDKADEEAYRRKFEVEAEITGNLEHPGVVPVYGLGTGANGRPYYAMRLVLGDNLTVRIDDVHRPQQRPTGITTRSHVDYNSVQFHGLIDRLIDVAQAINYAHSRGVLHRDLKPGNILVGEYGETLVIDWGLARVPRHEAEGTAALEATLDSGLDSDSPLNVRSGSSVDATQQGQILGTVGYAPPEQLDGRVHLISERSDVYGLGAILYQVLMGRPPIVVNSEQQLHEGIQQAIQGELTPPRQLNRAVPKSLAAICMKALQTRPEDRYATVSEFIDDLERWKADQPVSATRESWLDQVIRFVRRYRAATVATAVTMLGIILATSAALFWVNRARVNEVAAREEAETLATRNQAVVDSFVAAFESANPANEGVTSSMTAGEVLQGALRQLQSENLEEDPLTKATLLTASASARSALGETEEAITAFEMSQRLFDLARGDDHPDTLTTQASLAMAHAQVGDLEQALADATRAHELSLARWGKAHQTTYSSASAMGLVHQFSGQREKALEYYQLQYEIAQDLYQPEDDELLVAANNVALAHQYLGQLDEAILLYEETCRTLKRAKGINHPNTMICLMNLGMSYYSSERMDEAIAIIEEILAAQTEKLGRSHRDTMVTMDNLALLYDRAKRPAQALDLAKETLELRKVHLGEDHQDTLGSMGRMAEVLNSAGQHVEALQLAQQSLQKREELLGPEHPETLVGRHLLGWVYQSMGDLEAAVTTLQTTWDQRKRVLGPSHPATLDVAGNLAVVYELADDPAAAAAVREEVAAAAATP
ncbi:MAG: serine/threonine-protein kinase [Planctomycetota bacterium]